MGKVTRGLYAIGSTNGNLYAIDCVTGSLSSPKTLGINVVGITFSGSTLFGITPTQFLLIDPETATCAVVGTLGFDGAQSIAADSSGKIYCIATPDGEGTGLYTIDPPTGTGTLVGVLAPNIAPINTGSAGLAFDSNDQLYSTLMGATITGMQVLSLQTINTCSGAISIQDNPGIGFNLASGLTFFGDKLYGITSTGILFTVNVATGIGTQIGGIVNDVLELSNLASCRC